MKSHTIAWKALIWIQVVAAFFLGIPLSSTTRSAEAAPPPPIEIVASSDTPDPFSPNGDGMNDTNTASFTVAVRATRGLLSDGVGNKNTPLRFFVRYVQTIANSTTPITPIATLQSQIETFPLPTPSSANPPTDQPALLTVPLSSVWNGNAGAPPQPAPGGTPAPDGQYSYSLSATLVRLMPSGTERLLATSQAVAGTILLDRTEPQIAITSPADGSTIQTATPLVDCAFADALSGIQASSFAAFLDGVGVTQNFTVTAGTLGGTAVWQVPDASPLAQGQHALIVSVRDNAGTTGYATSTFTVQTITEPPILPESGFIDGIVYDATTQAPLQGATVSVAQACGTAAPGCELTPIEGQVQTNADGKFAFPTPGAGKFLLTITKPGYHYAQRWAHVESTRDVAVEPAYLLPVGATTPIDATSGGVAQSADGNVQVYFPPGALPHDMNITLTPIQHPRNLPGRLPEGVGFIPGAAFFGEPSGEYFTTPVTVRLRNTLGFAPGTQLPIGYWVREEGKWAGGALATVSADGQWFEGQWMRFSSGGVFADLWEYLFGEGGVEEDGDGTQTTCTSDGDSCAGVQNKSKIGYRHAYLQEDHFLPSVRRYGLSSAPRLVYRSDTVRPSHVIGMEAREVGWQTVEKIDADFSIGGNFRRATYEGTNSTFRSTMVFEGIDGRGNHAPTGAYKARVELRSYVPTNYATAAYFGGPALADTGVASPFPAPRSSGFSQTVMVHNRVGSVFGNGWGLDGLDRLHMNPDGSVLLAQGDGERRLFRPALVSGTSAGVAGSAGFSGDGGPASEAQLSYPEAVACDALGNLYIMDIGNRRIRKVSHESGVITTIAGNGTVEFLGDGIPATETGIGWLFDGTAPAAGQPPVVPPMAQDGNGTLYFADIGSHRVFKIDGAGLIWRVAGTGASGFSGDGEPATAAQLSWPGGLAVDLQGNLLIADTGNFRIRKVNTQTGVITTFAGTGESGDTGDNGPAASARFLNPRALAVDARGNLYVCDAYRVRRIDSSGLVAAFAGLPVLGFHGDGGLATRAAFWVPTSVAVGPDGSVYVTDHGNRRIRKIDPEGFISTAAGYGPSLDLGSSQYGGDGLVADRCRINSGKIAVDGAGNIYLADIGSHVVRKFSSCGTAAPGCADPSAHGTLEDTVNLVYDQGGNLHRVSDNDSGVAFDYGPAGQLNNTSTSYGSYFDTANFVQPYTVLEYQYDANLNRTRMNFHEWSGPGGTAYSTGEFQYEWDELNRLVRLTNPENLVTEFGYDTLSRRTQLRHANGVVTNYSYDTASQLTLLETANSLGELLSRFAYTYNAVGLRTSMTDYVKHAVGYTDGALDGGTADGGTHVYVYDALNRLVSTLNPENQHAWNPDEHFSYDAVGNRQTDIYNPAGSVETGVGYTYDSANRLLQDAHFWYDFDANGNQTKRIHKASVEELVAGGMSQAEAMEAATTHYRYGVENQLIRIDFPNLAIADPQTGEPQQQIGGSAEYRYDGLGRRIEKNVVKPVELGSVEDLADCVEDGFSTSITRFVYDNEDIVLEYGVIFTPNPLYPWWVNTESVLAACYTHGIGIDEPLIVTRPEEACFYLTDGLGSITQLGRLDNSVAQSRLYAAFGKDIRTSGSYHDIYGYTARELDSESGLLYYRARYLGPHGRFLQEDFLFQAYTSPSNSYSYCDNSPVSRTDPTGNVFFLTAFVGLALVLVAGTVIAYLATEQAEAAMKAMQYKRAAALGAAGGGAGGSVWLSDVDLRQTHLDKVPPIGPSFSAKYYRATVIWRRKCGKIRYFIIYRDPNTQELRREPSEGYLELPDYTGR